MFTEGEFGEIEHRSSRIEADAYAEGFVDGGNAYGAGSVAAYVLPTTPWSDDEKTMREQESEEAVTDAMEALNKLKSEQAEQDLKAKNFRL
jgi:hypothetical protein